MPMYPVIDGAKSGVKGKSMIGAMPRLQGDGSLSQEGSCKDDAKTEASDVREHRGRQQGGGQGPRIDEGDKHEATLAGAKVRLPSRTSKPYARAGAETLVQPYPYPLRGRCACLRAPPSRSRACSPKPSPAFPSTIRT